MPKPKKKHAMKKWESVQWPLIGGIALTALILGFVGFSKFLALSGKTWTPLDIVYLTLQLFTLESGALSGNIPWELEIARFLAPAVAAFAAFKALTIIFREQLQLIRVKFFRNHVVICGLGRKGMLLVQRFRSMSEKVVVIELDEGNDLVDQCREYGAVVFTGDATQKEMLKTVRVQKAKYLIAVAGDDGINAEVAIHAFDLVKDRKSHRLTCIVHIFDQQLSNLLREQEKEIRASDSFRIEYFNVYEKGATAWIDEYFLLDPDETRAHEETRLLVIGAGQLGESLVARAAQKWEESRRDKNKKLYIDIIDRYAETKQARLYSRNADLDDYWEITPLTMDVKSLDFQRGQFLFENTESCRYSKIFVCLDNDSLGLSVAMSLYQKLKGQSVAIVVRMARDAGLAILLRGKAEEGQRMNEGIFAFGLLDRTCIPEIILG
jgi:voltage-gated potassium channel Kch